MRMTSFAVLALSGLMATASMYVAPAMADDTVTSGPMKGDVGNTPNNNPEPNIGGIAQTDNMNIASNDDSNDMNGSGNANSGNDANANNDSNANNGDNNAVTNTPSATNPSANDAGAPDTATGDDDY